MFLLKKYNFERDEKFEKGFIQIKFDVKKGKIEHAKIFGDFFGADFYHNSNPKCDIFHCLIA
jgi:hypothetical protein